MRSYSIGSVAKLTGISQFTLRAWEARYKIAKPKRSPTGRRLYSDADVERLTLLKRLTERGHGIGDIAGLDVSRLNSLLDRGETRGPVAAKTLNDLEAALTKLELSEFGAVLNSARLQYDTRTFLLFVLAPLMRRIGGHVADGRLDIFHEHAASAVVRNILTGVLYSTQTSTRSSERAPVIFATPEGDFHEFGILIAAVLAALGGVRVFYLGPNTPASSLAKAAAALKSELAVIAVSAPEQSLSQPAVDAFLKQVRGELPTRCTMWLAGSRARGLKFPKSRNVHVLAGFEEFERRLESFAR